MEQDGTASFHFIHGDVESPPPNGFVEFFGSPPYRRFFEEYGSGTSNLHFHDAFWNTSYRSTPEQKYREVTQTLCLQGTNTIQTVLDRLYRILDDEGPFDGIIGNSEGAVMAATFIIDYLKKCERKEVRQSLQCAVFISGGAPPFPNGSGFFLADEVGQIISVPTCHIMAYNDPLVDTVIALHHLCDQASATIVDHGRGHLVPRDPRSSKLIIKGVRDLIGRVKTPFSEVTATGDVSCGLEGAGSGIRTLPQA